MAVEGLAIWTLGHSNRTLEDFVTLLRSHSIELVVDVRRFPGSRRYPHFNGEQLMAALRSAGISYVHAPDLGGRRTPHVDSRNSAWRNEGFRGYADYMETAEFRAAMGKLTAEARNHRTAVMCAEALWWQCHRSMIADFLKASGWKVLHILASQKTEEHKYTAPARVVNGALTYHQDQPQLALEEDRG
jgi:uncharacterized protein (DUF488 family)